MPDKIKILFDSYHLYHLPQFEPLIDLLDMDKRFDIFHSTSNEIPNQEYKLCSSILRKKPGTFIEAKTEKMRQGKIKNLDLDFFICGWSRYDIDKYVTIKTIVGMIYHGIGIKPSYWLDNHQRLDMRFVEGEYRVQQLQQNGIDTRLELTGFIKLDPIFHKNKIDINSIKQKYNLDPNKKTILFAPTFYPSSVEPIGMKLGEYTKGFNVLIKPHLWTTFLNKFAEINHKRKNKIFNGLIKNYDHIHLIPPEDYNIIPFYKVADVLLTEASSTIYEMLACGKPVVVNRFFKLKLSHRLFKYRLYKKRLNQEMEKDISSFCFEAHKPSDIPLALDSAFNRFSIKQDKVKEYQKKMLFKLDGLAASRAKEIILSYKNN